MPARPAHPSLSRWRLFFALVLAGCATTAFARKIPVIAVAEHGPAAAAVDASSALPPGTYAAFDAGYVEAGDAIAGETPPSATAVSAALHAAMARAGYTQANATASPSIVLVYHWGVIRKDSIQLRPAYEIQPNFHTRLLLVTPETELPRVENWLVQRRDYPGSPARLFETPTYRDAVDYARDPLYFVVISAYETHALARREGPLLWRVKLSAPDNVDAMRRTLPALLSVADRYIGRSLRERDHTNAFTAAPSDPVAPAATEGDSATPPTATPAGIDPAFFEQLVKDEHAEFSGERRPRPSAKRSAAPALPPALVQRIADYRRDKTALQQALAERLKAQPAGTPTTPTIDAFRSEYAQRMQVLVDEREAIRRELARLSARRDASARDKSLDALLREFNSSVKQLDPLPAQP